MKTILKPILTMVICFVAFNFAVAQKQTLSPYIQGTSNEIQTESIDVAFFTFPMSTTGQWVIIAYDKNTGDYHSFDSYLFDVKWYGAAGDPLGEGIALTVDPGTRVVAVVTNVRSGMSGYASIGINQH
ncbi:MAG: hypothetical protein AAF502_24480 [Bacteroidota bacterium]